MSGAGDTQLGLGPLAAAEALLDLARLSRKAADVVTACCAQLGVAAREWSSAREEAAGDAAVLVSGLRWGERAIPPELLAAAQAPARRVPLLLLSAEPLVAPAVELHEGLVTIAGAPLSPDRLVGELRICLSRALGEALALPAPSGFERSHGPIFCAATGSADARLPLLREAVEGFAALVPLASDGAGLPDDGSHGDDHSGLADAGAALEAGDLPAIAAALGSRAGLVRLDADAREWLVYWPSASAPLFFHSPARFPRCVDLRPMQGEPPRLHRFAAARGDAVACLSTPAPAAFPLADALAGGAPGFLHRAAASLAAHDAPWSLFCMEARA